MADEPALEREHDGLHPVADLVFGLVGITGLVAWVDVFRNRRRLAVQR